MITVTTISNNQTFGALISTTNRLANLMSSNVVTADATTTGSSTTGNVVVNGHFGATYLYAGSGIIGGNLASNGELSILSNTFFKDNNGANQVSVLSNSSVSTVEIQSNTISLTPSNNTTISGQLLTISANVTITGNTFATKKIDVNALSEITTTSNTFLSTSAVALDTFDKSVYRSAEYVVQCSYANTSVYQISRIHVVHNDTTAYSTEFGIVSSNGTSIASFTSSVSGSNVVITITPTVAPLAVKATRLITTV